MNTAHLALKIPEIVGHILSFVAIPEQDKGKQYKSIYPCLFVNSLWHDCAYRYLWRSVLFEETGHESFQKFTSTITNTPLQKTFHMQEEYAQWMTLFSNKHSTGHVIHVTHQPSENQVYSHHEQYRQIIRSLSLWKIKEKTINGPIQQIAPYLQRLEKLEFYICDHLLDQSIQAMIQHNMATLSWLSLAGCCLITDDSILQVAKFCPRLKHLDLRACGQISDRSIMAIAKRCPDLHHLNVGRVRDREKITIKSIGMIAKYTQISVLGLAGCDMTDECLLMLAKYRGKALERISVNNCYRLTNKIVQVYARHCPNLSVFEMKECHWIDDWASVTHMVERRVLLTLCEQQNRACSEWASRNGKRINIKAPVK